MKKNRIVTSFSIVRFIIGFWLFSTSVWAQTTPDSAAAVVIHREIGLNTTALLDRFLPFGVQQFTGPTDLMFKRYRNNRAFKFGISAQIVPDLEVNNRIVLRFGVENRYRLTQRKWSYTRSWELMTGVGRLNLPGFIVTENQNPFFLGGMLTYGIEYNINQRVSLMTEGGIFGGIRSVENDFGDSDGSIALLAMPPIALYVIIKMP